MIDPQARYLLMLRLARRPCFCCGCWCLQSEDARRTKRVLALVRAICKSWRST